MAAHKIWSGFTTLVIAGLTISTTKFTAETDNHD
jgi:hypothetical protein